MAHSGDGTQWDTTMPANLEPVYKGALEIRDLRKAVGIRQDKEHVDAATSSVGGEHVQGSARPFYLATASAPTTQIDGGAFTSEDFGLFWVDTTLNQLNLLTGVGPVAWTSIGAMLGMTWSNVGADPAITCTNTDQEDSEGGRQTTLTFNGEQSDGESSTLATIIVSHAGTGDDQKGQIVLNVNGHDGLIELCRFEALDGSDEVQLLMNSKKIAGLAAGTASGEALHQGQLDDSTIEEDSGTVQVKDAGITAAKMAAGAAWQNGAAAQVYNQSPAVADTWESVDCSGTVGSNFALVYIQVVTDTSNYYQYFKPSASYGDSPPNTKHSTVNSSGGIGNMVSYNGQYFYTMVATHSDGTFQYASNGTSQTVTIKIVGFIK